VDGTAIAGEEITDEEGRLTLDSAGTITSGTGNDELGVEVEFKTWTAGEFTVQATGDATLIGKSRSVTEDGKNCSSRNTYLSSGQMPAVLKPDFMFSGVAAFNQAYPINSAI